MQSAFQLLMFSIILVNQPQVPQRWSRSHHSSPGQLVGSTVMHTLSAGCRMPIVFTMNLNFSCSPLLGPLKCQRLNYTVSIQSSCSYRALAHIWDDLYWESPRQALEPSRRYPLAMSVRRVWVRLRQEGLPSRASCPRLDSKTVVPKRKAKEHQLSLFSASWPQRQCDQLPGAHSAMPALPCHGELDPQTVSPKRQVGLLPQRQEKLLMCQSFLLSSTQSQQLSRSPLTFCSSCHCPRYGTHWPTLQFSCKP